MSLRIEHGDFQHSVRGGARTDVYVVGRLNDGVREEAQNEMQVIAARLDQDYPDANKGRGILLKDFAEPRVQIARFRTSADKSTPR